MGKHIKSKRQTLKHKYKVERKVREHHRQVRKDARKNKRDNAISKKRLKKDPGIPNTVPFKQQIIEDLERRRIQAEEKRKAARQAKRDARTSSIATQPGDVAEFGKQAAARTANFDADPYDNVPMTGSSASAEATQTKRAFMREFKRVLDASDVLLEVLDARDPLGCRCRDAERAVVTAGKRIVLVLNKVDLVPREVVDKWLSYLRNDYPTIAFRASTQGGGTVGQARVSAVAASAVGTSECLGGQGLMGILKNYALQRKLKTTISVGVIGYPNVGKSSLINSMKRSRAVNVGATPGVTRKAQEVRIDSNISLVDCPGIVFADDDAEDALVLRNAVRIEQIVDPIRPVEMIVKRIGHEPLMVAYGLPQFSNVTEFLALICKTKGKYKRGGVFDVESAARMVLADWNGAKIPFYTLPPKGLETSHVSAEIVKSWGEEFKIDEAVKNEREELDKLPQDETMLALSTEAKVLESENSMTQVPVESDTGGEQTYHVAKKDIEADAAKKRQREGKPSVDANTMQM